MDNQAKQYLSFDIGEERYTVPVVDVEVVLEMPSITRVPRAARHLRGVINHRGTVIPVVDLRVLFGFEMTTVNDDLSVIVTEILFDGDTITAGVLADAVHEVIYLDQADIEQSPSWGTKIDNSFIAGIAKYAGQFIILLKLEQALAGAGLGDQER